jgi:transcriptional regulator with XRE-family HTH domain
MEPVQRGEHPVWSSDAMRRAVTARDVGRIVALARRAAGLSQAELAALCSYSQSTISRLETNRQGVDDIRLLRQVVNALNLPPHFVGLAPDSPPTPSPVRSRPAAGPGLDPEPLLRTARVRRVGMSTVQAFQAAIADYWRRDDEHGSETLRPAVIGQLDYVRDLLDQPQSEGVRQSLYATAAELSRLAGWMLFDARHYSTASRYFRQGRRAGEHH